MVVLGTALYLGRWRRSAVRLLAGQAAELRRRPTWHFQSGPCGAGARTAQVAPPPNVRRLAERIGVNPPVTFGGRLTPETAVGWVARKMATGDKQGDFRDWVAIRQWARLIVAGTPVLTVDPVAS